MGVLCYSDHLGIFLRSQPSSWCTKWVSNIVFFCLLVCSFKWQVGIIKRIFSFNVLVTKLVCSVGLISNLCSSLNKDVFHVETRAGQRGNEKCEMSSVVDV